MEKGGECSQLCVRHPRTHRMKRAMPPAVTQHPGAHSTKREQKKRQERERERERERKRERERERKRERERERERERKKERKTERRVPSYGENIQGHVGRKELCLQLWFSTQERTAKGKRGQEKVFPATTLRPRTHQGKALPATTTHPGTRWRRKLLRPGCTKNAQRFIRNLLIAGQISARTLTLFVGSPVKVVDDPPATLKNISANQSIYSACDSGFHTHTSQNLSHTISYTTHLTHLISYITSHTTHVTHSHTHHKTYLIHNSSHTTHLTPIISHNSPHTSHLTHNSSHTTHHTQLTSHNSSHNYSSHTTLISHTTHLTHKTCELGAGRFLKELRRGLSPAGPRLLSAWQAQYTEPSEGVVARIVAGWAAASLCVAGAVHRAFWRSCGADCRRLGRGSPLRGRRSTQRLLKELGRGLSPAGPRLLCAWQAQYSEPPEAAAPAGPRLSFAWQAQYTEASEGAGARIVAGWAAASLCVAGAILRASWSSCGADCRRLGRGFSLRGRRSTQKLLKELGRGLCGFSLRGRRSTQSLLKELRRGLSPAGPRLSFAWQAQYTEPPEGGGAGADCRRLGRAFSLRGRRSTQRLLKELRRGLSPAGPRLSFAWQAQYTEPPKELRRGLSPAGPRLLSAWQAQYTEPSEGVVARIVAGWAAASLCVAGAVHRAFWRSSPLRGRRSTQSLLKELGRGLSPAGPRLLSAWQAQYTEPSEGAAARIVAGWAAAGLSPLLYWRLQKRCLRDRYASPQLY